HETMQNDTVTVRERDSMQQVRMPVDRLVDELRARVTVGRAGVVTPAL
ncbi:MAG: hypothetical protein H6Q34_1176, partial [Deltaproteobacteria bacterium]|nr:hypothetical protein [Deltaproteobacteria bacterium]